MKIEEKLKKQKLNPGFVFVIHTTQKDPEGDECLMQIPEGQLNAFILNGWKRYTPKSKTVEAPIV